MNKIYLTTREAATYSGFAESTLEKARIYGGGPAFCRVGRTIRYRVEDIDAWISAGRMNSTSGQVISAAA